MNKVVCHQCGHEKIFDALSPLSRRDECEKCQSDLKVCLNCEFYDVNSHWECKESISERVKDKDRANYCDAFKARGQNLGQKNSSDDLLKAAEALFKKKT